MPMSGEIILAMAIAAVLVFLVAKRRRSRVEKNDSPKASMSQPSTPAVPSVPLIDFDASTNEGFDVAVVGESNYQGAIRRIHQSNPRGDRIVKLTLRRDVENTRPNAIVVQSLDGRTVGYLGDEDSEDYTPAFLEIERRCLRLICSAKLTGASPGKTSYGVVLDLPLADELIQRVTGDPQPF